MKKAIYILMYALALTACYKDLSKEASIIIPDLVVTGMPETLDVVYGQEINISVKAYMGEKTGADFEYLWEIDLTADNPNNRVELGTEATLTYQVNNTPSGIPYLLDVRVTDPATGLQAIKSCFVHVGSSLGEGLLVAYTRQDGVTSEFDIVSTPQVTYGYTGDPRIVRGLYALANGAPYPEKITCLLQTVESDNAVYNVRRIIAGSLNHVIAIDPLTFEEREKDAQLFNSTTITEFGPSILFNSAGYSSYMFIGGQAYAHLCNIDNVYAKLSNSLEHPIVFSPTNVGWACLDQGRTVVFNESDGFYEALGYQLLGGGFFKMDVDDDLSFNPVGAHSIMGGCLRNMRPAFLIQDAAGSYHIAVIVPGSNSDSFFCVPFDGENIADAVSVAFCDSGDLMYYATENTIYSTIISGNTSQTSKLSWSPDSADEKITFIKQYTQAWYGTMQMSPSDYGFILPTHRNMLIIVTQNSRTGEGKFYLRGFNVNNGRFTISGNYGSYGGFGEITAIASTLR